MSLVPQVIGQKIAHHALLAQKASPQVLFVAGIVGVVGSAVLASRATLKADEVVKEAKVKRELFDVMVNDDEKYEGYREDDLNHDVKVLYWQTGYKIAKLYAPAVIVGGLSIAALTSSHNILTSRNAALTAAYTALDRGFRSYRAAVVEKYGEEQDRDFRYGVEEVEIVNPETNRKKKVKRINPEPSVYARFFDETCRNWDRNPDYNRAFLMGQQNWANDRLSAYGHVFLNEVYDLLGMERSQAGQVVGWIRSDDGSTDNYISFDIWNGSEQANDFVNLKEGSILLDFNVDGVIWDKLDTIDKGKLTWNRRRRT